MFSTDGEQGGGEAVGPDGLAVLMDGIPVDLSGMDLGKEANVTDLTDAEAAVEKMLESV